MQPTFSIPITALAVLVAAWTAPLDAGVQVRSEAAWQGSYGLRADVAPDCQGDETVLITEPVSGSQTFEACKEVVAISSVTSTGDLVLTAGRRVVFGDGFSVSSGGRLAAGTSGAWNPSSVIQTAPASEPRLWVRWQMRFDGAGLAPAERLALFSFEGARGRLATLRYEAGAGGGWLWTEAAEEDGARTLSGRTWAGPGWHSLELRYDAGAVLTPTGELELTVDGSSRALLSGLRLGQSLIDSVRLGAFDASAAGGWIDLDSVAGSRAGPIGE